MSIDKHSRLETDGRTVGSADELLGLAAYKSTVFEIKLALAGLQSASRKAASLIQADLSLQDIERVVAA